jgi:hypothetical protein
MDQRCFGRLVAEMQSLRWTTSGHKAVDAMFLYGQSSATCLRQTTTRQDSRCRSERVLLVFGRRTCRSLQATRLVARHTRPGDP